MSRKDKVQEAIRQEVAAIIHDELKDPRIGFATVTRAEVTADLRHAKIYVSVLGKQKSANSTLKALESGKGYMRTLLAKRLKMRFTPDLMFKEDKSAEYSVEFAKKLEEIKNEDK
ncbi:30S ribosome-binding factor RbfA [Candidatus Omnitrophota bacterium]